MKHAAAFVVLAPIVFLGFCACNRDSLSCANITQSPVALDHSPAFPVLVQQVPYSQVSGRCLALGANEAGLWACNRIGGGITAIIVLPEADGINFDRAGQDCLLHHEWGHLNGWPANHPGARFT